MRIHYNSRAREELVDVLKYYENEAGLETAVEFFSEFERVTQRLLQIQDRFRKSGKAYDVAFFNRFPYQVNYEIVDESTVKILAIKHQRRDPDFGLNR